MASGLHGYHLLLHFRTRAVVFLFKNLQDSKNDEQQHAATRTFTALLSPLTWPFGSFLRQKNTRPSAPSLRGMFSRNAGGGRTSRGSVRVVGYSTLQHILAVKQTVLMRHGVRLL